MRTLGLAVVALASVTMSAASADIRDTLFPKEGCSPFSRTSPCATRSVPAPVGDPTDGPLTEKVRKGPLDPRPDPLGPKAKLPPMPEIRPQTLPSQQD